jgi:hypothetical protein
LGNKFSHLTNASINKYSPQYDIVKEGIGPGSKWTLKQLQHYFEMIGINYDNIWKKIENLLNLTLISFVETIPKNTECCFELYGFGKNFFQTCSSLSDVILDAQLKPWLLEINFSPALSSDSNIDDLVKKPLIADMVKALQFKKNSPSLPAVSKKQHERATMVSTLKLPPRQHPRPLTSVGNRTNIVSRPSTSQRDTVSALATYRRPITSTTKTRPKTEQTLKLVSPQPKPKNHEKDPSEAGTDVDGSCKLQDEHGDFYLIFPPNTAVKTISTQASTGAQSFDTAMREIVTHIKKRETKKSVK